MGKIAIKHRYTYAVICEFEAKDIKDCLEQAVKSNANLRGADLRGAYLRGANLRGANLGYFKTDILDILLRAPKEIAGLKQALIDGKVDGSVYEGECACLVGTIANIRGVQYDTLANGIKPNSRRPAEQWFMSIKKGDTPESSSFVKLTVEWIEEYQQLIEALSV